MKFTVFKYLLFIVVCSSLGAVAGYIQQCTGGG